MIKTIKYDSAAITCKNPSFTTVSCVIYYVFINDFSIFKTLLNSNLIEISEDETNYDLNYVKHNLSFFI